MDQITKEVIRIVLACGGIFRKPQNTDLPKKISDIVPGGIAMATLRAKIRELVKSKNPDATLTDAQINACDTIQDLVDLVKNAIQII